MNTLPDVYYKKQYQQLKNRLLPADRAELISLAIDKSRLAADTKTKLIKNVKALVMDDTTL